MGAARFFLGRPPFLRVERGALRAVCAAGEAQWGGWPRGAAGPVLFRCCSVWALLLLWSGGVITRPAFFCELHGQTGKTAEGSRTPQQLGATRPPCAAHGPLDARAGRRLLGCTRCKYGLVPEAHRSAFAFRPWHCGCCSCCRDRAPENVRLCSGLLYSTRRAAAGRLFPLTETVDCRGCSSNCQLHLVSALIRSGVHAA